MFVETTFCVDLLREARRGQVGPATIKLRSLGDTRLHVSMFVLCELRAGARMAGHPRRELAAVDTLCRGLALVLPDEQFPSAYGAAEASLRAQGIPIPTMDLLIGVTSVQHGLPLITRDPTHFSRIPGLALETY